jgi:hypothetical protein
MPTGDTVGDVLGPITLAIESGNAYVYMYIDPGQARQLAAELMVVADSVKTKDMA